MIAAVDAGHVELVHPGMIIKGEKQPTPPNYCGSCLDVWPCAVIKDAKVAAKQRADQMPRRGLLNDGPRHYNR